MSLSIAVIELAKWAKNLVYLVSSDPSKGRFIARYINGFL
jgi:hypothetical protein